jgi:hypothetical protein
MRSSEHGNQQLRQDKADNNASNSIAGIRNQCHKFLGYSQPCSSRLKRGIAKYVRPTTSIIVMSMLETNGICPK